MSDQVKSKLISELELSQTKIKQAEDRYRYLFDSLADAIFVHDMTSNIIDANKHACTKYGYSIEKLKTMLVKDIDIPDHAKHIEERVQNLMKNGSVVFESVHRDVNGNQFPVEATATLGYYEGQQVVMVICHDITKRKKAEEELLKTEKLESVGILAGGIAHDFNNILTGILGNIELAAIYTNKDSEAYSLLAEAIKASNRAKDLTQQLLTFSKGGDPVKRTSSIGNVITDSAKFVLHGSSVMCRFDIPDDLWKLDLDTGQISQVIQNIILNARQAMPKGGVIDIACRNIEDTEKEEQLLHPKKYVIITITDTGSGIPQSIIDKIFDPYFSTKQEGSGLGLAICNSIITKHEGYISVHSEEGKGTTVSIYLPASKSVVSEAEKNIYTSEKNSTKASVMIMDDEYIIRIMTKKMLELSGHEVLLAKNGVEAIKIYNEYLQKGSAIDVIIMDLTIPGGMGGKETVIEILKINPKAKVIVSSGYSNDPIMANCKEYGFKASLSKPFQIEEINSLISKILLDQ